MRLPVQSSQGSVLGLCSAENTDRELLVQRRKEAKGTSDEKQLLDSATLLQSSGYPQSGKKIGILMYQWVEHVEGPFTNHGICLLCLGVTKEGWKVLILLIVGMSKFK